MQSLLSVEKEKTELENRIIELTQEVEKGKKRENKLKLMNSIKINKLKVEFESDSKDIISKMESLDKELESKDKII